MAKKSVHLTTQTEQFITDRTMQGESPNYSAHINAAFNQLTHLLQEQQIGITNDEWIELYNLYAGSDLTKIALPINIASDLLVHYGVTVPKQLSEHCQILIDKLVLMTQAQQLAVIDKVRLYWASGL